MSEFDTLPPDSDKTSPHHEPPEADESLTVFADIVGKELDKRLGGILDGINEILAFAQEVPAMKTQIAEQGRRIESLEAWKARVERLLPGAAE